MKVRDSYFDNAKFLLIILVVFGHLIRSYIEDNELMMQVYKLIYTFHMPAFILISGYFAKGFQKPGYLKNLVKKLILPYFIFQGIYTVFFYYIKNESSLDLNLLDPNWSLWFLLSLFYWNALLFILSKWNWKSVMGMSLLLGILAGYADFLTNFLSLARTFVFLPVFLLGFYMKRSYFEMLASKSGRLISAGILLGTFILYHFVPFDFKWLHGSLSYSQVGANGPAGGFIRGIVRTDFFDGS